MAATIETGFLPEEDGRDIKRLIVFEDGKAIDSVIIESLTIDCVIEKFQLLAWRLKLHKSK